MTIFLSEKVKKISQEKKQDILTMVPRMSVVEALLEKKISFEEFSKDFNKERVDAQQGLQKIMDILEYIDHHWAIISHKFDLKILFKLTEFLTQEFAKKLEVMAQRKASFPASISCTIALIEKLDQLIKKTEKIKDLKADGKTIPLTAVFISLEKILQHTPHEHCDHLLNFSMLKNFLKRAHQNGLLKSQGLGQLLKILGKLAKGKHTQGRFEVNFIIEIMKDSQDFMETQDIVDCLMGSGLLAEQFLLEMPLEAKSVNQLLKIFIKRLEKKEVDVNAALPLLLGGLSKLLQTSAIKNLVELEVHSFNKFLQVCLKYPEIQSKTIVEVVKHITTLVGCLASPPTSLPLSSFAQALAVLKSAMIKENIPLALQAQQIGSVLSVMGEMVKSHPQFYAEIATSGCLKEVEELLKFLCQKIETAPKSALNMKLIISLIGALRGKALLGMSDSDTVSEQLSHWVLSHLKEQGHEFDSEKLNSLVNQFALYLLVTQKKGEDFPEWIKEKLTAQKPPSPKPGSLQTIIAEQLKKRGCTEVATEKELGPYPVDIYAAVPADDEKCPKRTMIELDGLHHLDKFHQAKDAFKTDVLIYKGLIDQVIRFSVLGVKLEAEKVVNTIMETLSEAKKPKASEPLYAYIARQRGFKPKEVAVTDAGDIDKIPVDSKEDFPKPVTVEIASSAAIDKVQSSPKKEKEVDKKPANFLEAVKQGDVDTLKKLLSVGIPVNPYTQQKDAYVLTVSLMYALQQIRKTTSKKTWLEVIERLITASSAQSLQEEKQGLSPLIVAIHEKERSEEGKKVYEWVYKKAFAQSGKSKRGKKGNVSKDKPSPVEIIQKATEKAKVMDSSAIDPVMLLQKEMSAHQKPDEKDKKMEVVTISGEEELSIESIAKNVNHPIYQNRADIDLKLLHKRAESGDANAQFILAGQLRSEAKLKQNKMLESVAEYWLIAAVSQGHVNAQSALGGFYLLGTRLDEAKPWLEKAAEQKDPLAQFMLGFYYSGESEVTKDLKKAVFWYLKAARQGYALGQYNLGIYYYRGQGIAKNLDEAIKWITAAARQGYASAQYSLGICYYHGEGVDKNLSKAVELFTAAAEQEHASAQCNLGACYYHGLGVAKNLDQAIKWMTASARQGYASAQYSLAICYCHGEGVEKNLSKAVELFTAAAEQGHMKAKYHLGLCYHDGGEGVTKDLKKAFKCYAEAAQLGDVAAKYHLGVCYYNGEGIAKNFSEAAAWFTVAAKKGYASAQYSLGACYYQGEGVTQNLSAAFECFTAAAEQGHTLAKYNLGICYYYGEGVTQNLSQAFEWYKAAAEQEYALAQLRLATCYRKGEGIAKDMEKALYWYQKAADQGLQPAKEALKLLQKDFSLKKTQESDKFVFTHALKASGSPVYARTDVLAEAKPDKKNILSLVQHFNLSSDSPDQLETGLRRAAANNKLTALKQFLKLSVNVNAQDSKQGKTALHHAAAKNLKDCVQVLLTHGADHSIKDKSGKKPSDYTSDPEILKLLESHAQISRQP